MIDQSDVKNPPSLPDIGAPSKPIIRNQTKNPATFGGNPLGFGGAQAADIADCDTPLDELAPRPIVPRLVIPPPVVDLELLRKPEAHAICTVLVFDDWQLGQLAIFLPSIVFVFFYKAQRMCHYYDNVHSHAAILTLYE